MKHGKIISLAMAALLVFSLAGCGGKKPDEEKEEKKPAKLEIDYVKENEKIDNAVRFVNPNYSEDSEYMTEVVIKTDQDITEVNLLSVEEGDFSGEKHMYISKSELYKADKLEADKPLVFVTEFPNYLVNYALCYKDVTGEYKVKGIVMSGQDSSISFEEGGIQKGEKAPSEARVTMTAVEDDSDLGYPEQYVFIDPVYDSENHMNILVSTDLSVTNLKILDAELKSSEGDKSVFATKGVIYELPELVEKAPLLYHVQFEGDLPSRVITYTDASGEEKAYSLSLSGKDGSLVVEEAVVEK